MKRPTFSPSVRKPTKPDAGYAWVVLVASWCSSYLSGVLVYFVGVIHVELLNRYRSDVTTTAWAGSLYSSLQMLAAPLASWIVHRHSCRASMIVGGVLLCVGFFVSAFAASVVQLVFTYGLVAGVGLGLVYSPTLMIVTFYFDRFRALASGVSVSGAALGILSGSLMTQAAIDSFGLSGAFMLIAGFSFNQVVFGMLYRPTHHEGLGSGPGAGRSRPAGPRAAPAAEFLLDAKDEKSRVRPDGVTRTDDPHKPFDRTILISADAVGGTDPEGRRAPGERTPCADPELGGANLEDPERRKSAGTDLETDAKGDVSAGSEEQSLREQRETRASCPSVDESASKNGTAGTTGERDLDLAENPRSEEQDPADPSDVLEEDSERQVLLNSEDDTRPRSSARADETTTTSSGPASGDGGGGDGVTGRSNGRDIDSGGGGGGGDAASERLLGGSSSTTEARIGAAFGAKSSDASGGGTTRSASDKTSPECSPLSRKFSAVLPLLKNKPFLSHCVGAFLHGVNLSGVYLHLPEYARTLGTTPTRAAALFVGVGILSLVSRLGSGLLLTSRRVNGLLLSACLMCTCGAATGLFPLYSATYVGQMGFACLFGLSTGGINTLINVLNVELVDFKDLAASYGVSIFIMGSGYVMGPPMAGAIVDSGGTYEHSFIFLGLAAVVSGAFDLLGKVLRARQRKHDDKLNTAAIA